MSKQAYKRYLYVQAQLETDEEFLDLTERRRALEPKAGDILAGLTRAQRDVLAEYYGLSQEMCLRALELACFGE